MKIKNITLNNFAKYDQVTCSFDDNVTYLIGKNGSGKSTLGITAIWFMFQGIAEKSSSGNNPLIGERFRFIGPKSASAKGEMILHDEKKGIDIKVIRKLTKTGSEVYFEAPAGYDLSQSWLNDLFNIFLIAPKRFTELSPKEQAKALGINTKKFDDDLAVLKSEYSDINAVIRSMGEVVEVPKVERVIIDDLLQQKQQIREKLNQEYLDNKEHNRKLEEDRDKACGIINDEVAAWNLDQDQKGELIESATELFNNLTELGYKGKDVEKWIKCLPKAEEYKVASKLYPPVPEFKEERPDDTPLKEIDQKILDATDTNLKALEYEQAVEKRNKKAEKEKALALNKKKQADKETERVNYVKNFKFPFSNLSVGEDGELLLQGKPIKEPYFSTGEILKVVPILISTINPDLKYVFLQDFNLMDDEKQADIEKYLTEKGFQLVVEMVGKAKITDKNCILLRDNVIVEDYTSTKEPELV